jgi:hypothetical protein
MSHSHPQLTLYILKISSLVPIRPFQKGESLGLLLRITSWNKGTSYVATLATLLLVKKLKQPCLKHPFPILMILRTKNNSPHPPNVGMIPPLGHPPLPSN